MIGASISKFVNPGDYSKFHDLFKQNQQHYDDQFIEHEDNNGSSSSSSSPTKTITSSEYFGVQGSKSNLKPFQCQMLGKRCTTSNNSQLKHTDVMMTFSDPATSSSIGKFIIFLIYETLL
jgi:hypothetical protein